MRLNPRQLRFSSIYQIFPRNYTPEGNLETAAARLGEVAELGFSYVYITPAHPIGLEKRKGSLGSPYAIRDYRSIDPLLGGEKGLKVFIDRAHELGLGVIMDVVYNHTSPDSVLARERPEWFWKNADGKPGPRIADWSDVADLDYRQTDLWDYQIETLETWARFGADGFRCDVASLVPQDFWNAARERLDRIKPLLWLAESIHMDFAIDCRRRGIPTVADPLLHSAFDISYDYDGRQVLEAAWAGKTSLSAYLQHLRVQEALYPEEAIKLRFLENHDQARAAARFGQGSRLKNWTLFAMLLPGTFMAYMGEEYAMKRQIGLFDSEPLKNEERDESFRPFFKEALRLSTQIKKEAPYFEAEELAEGLVLLRRKSQDGGKSYAALLNLDGRSGWLKLHNPVLSRAFAESPLMGRIKTVSAQGRDLEIEAEPLLAEISEA